MSTPVRPSLQRFAEFIRTSDPHAAARLPLLECAEAALAGGAASSVERQALAAKLERWRYQSLHSGAGQLRQQERDLLDALDLAANALAGRPPRPPRWPRAAIGDASLDDGPIAEALACLDPHVSLKDVADRAAALTQAHFGRTSDRPATPEAFSPPSSPRRWRVLLYAPLYLSNYCINHCLYCGFRYPGEAQRKHLSVEEALGEAEVLRHRGFRHILLVAGDFPRLTTTDYFATILRALGERGVSPGIEIAPQSTEAYAALAQAGACGVTLYQETYDEELYRGFHPRGSKVYFDWRLEGLDRAADAGINRLGLGILLGMAEPRQDLRRMLRHARYLAGRYPDRGFSFSLPRIHQAPPEFRIPYPVEDELFVRMYCALRTAFPKSVLVLSTRESAELRNRLAAICITQLSAGSSTSPGGYCATAGRAAEQFPVCDGRSPKEVVDWLAALGFEPIWDLFASE